MSDIATITPTSAAELKDTPPVSPQQPRLLDRVRDRLRVKHYSYRTEQSYVHWIKRFILFHGKRHPADMGAAEVEAFLSALATELDVAASLANDSRTVADL